MCSKRDIDLGTLCSLSELAVTCRKSHYIDLCIALYTRIRARAGVCFVGLANVVWRGDRLRGRKKEKRNAILLWVWEAS